MKMKNNKLFNVLVLVVFIRAVNSDATISCFQCKSIDSDSQYQCTEYMENYDLVSLPCKNDSNAKYCIKVIGHHEGRGVTRFCSARDLGNYCDFFKRPGDRFSFMSCVYTCDSDGCNSSTQLDVFEYLVGILLMAVFGRHLFYI